MKKAILSTVLATAAFVASAADVTVSAVRDSKTNDYGFRAEGQVFGLTVSGTHLPDHYNRLAVGKHFNVAAIGPVKVSAGMSAVRHDRSGMNNDGYGLSVNLKASYDLSKHVSVVAGMEQFHGQDRVKDTNGVATSVGLRVMF